LDGYLRQLDADMTPFGNVLILSDQPVIAALVAVLVELVGGDPVFAGAGEQASDALRRLRPIAVILIDAETTLAQSDVFFAHASKAQARVVVFGSENQVGSIAEIASSRRIPWFTLPPGKEDIHAALSSALGWVNPRAEQRRREPEAVATPDGTRILSDGSGRRWMILDRRDGRDRRAATAVADRLFVAEDGETRRYQGSDVPLSDEPAQLLAQLELATFG
jgi:hypothetical protein